jgi:hypothetical protein
MRLSQTFRASDAGCVGNDEDSISPSFDRMGNRNQSCEDRRSVFTLNCDRMNLGAHSRDRRFSTPVSAAPNRESDFFNPSIHSAVLGVSVKGVDQHP